MKKFTVTTAGRIRPTNKSYLGDYEVLDSGVLKITSLEGDVEYLSAIAWLWVGWEDKK